MKIGGLESNSDEHLRKIKELLNKYGMYVELDMRNLDYERLVEVLEVANKLGADVIRSYIPIKPLERKENTSKTEGAYDFAKVRYDFDMKSYDEGIEKVKELFHY